MSIYTEAVEQDIAINRLQATDFMPRRMVEIELGQPLPLIAALDAKTGQFYQRALCLVRLHTQPLGLIELPLGEHGANAQEYVQLIWDALQKQIIEHLHDDGLPPVASLDERGLLCSDTPQCIREQERFLADAPLVSIIVPTSNRPDRIQTCLRFLLALDYPRYEIIVVDNAPTTNATADIIENDFGDDPRVRYVREDFLGCSNARNRGMVIAKGTLLAFVDDDVTIDTHWLTQLVRAFDAADDVACVTGLILPLELETPAQFWLEEYGGFGKGFTRRIFDMKENRPLGNLLYPYTAGSFGSGASMVFKAEYLRSVGGFDTVLDHGSDIEAFFQVVIRGYRLVYEPGAIVYHPHHREYKKLRKQLIGYGEGLTAFLTKLVLQRPVLLFDLAKKIPYGFFFVLSSQSPKNRKKRASYPDDLTRNELKGMLSGPFVYIHRRWITTRNTRSFIIKDS